MRALPLSRRLLASILSIHAVLVVADGNAQAACKQMITAQKGDTCFKLADDYGISVTAFLHNNPTVSSCSKLNIGGQYCVDPDSSSNTPDSTGGGGLGVSNDGTCGNGITCQGSRFGDCCSAHGWCGGTADHCGAGCDAGFGLCGAAGVSGNHSSSSSSPATTAAPSPSPSTSFTSPSPPKTPITSRTADTPLATLKTLYTTVVETSTSLVVRTQFNTLPATVTNTVTTAVTKTATAVVTNTAYFTATATSTSISKLYTTVTNTIQKTETSRSVVLVTNTQYTTVTTEESTVVTSTLMRTSRVTRTMTQTEIDTSIITTITTVTLVVSQTAAAQWCTRTERETRLSRLNDAAAPTPTMPGQINNCKFGSSGAILERTLCAYQIWTNR